MADCRGCGAPIRWLRTFQGRAMPVDPEPNPDGNVQITQGRAKVLGGDAAEQARGQHIRLYMPHFASCPERDRFTKGASGG